MIMKVSKYFILWCAIPISPHYYFRVGTTIMKPKLAIGRLVIAEVA